MKQTNQAIWNSYLWGPDLQDLLRVPSLHGLDFEKRNLTGKDLWFCYRYFIAI